MPEGVLRGGLFLPYGETGVFDEGHRRIMAFVLEDTHNRDVRGGHGEGAGVACAVHRDGTVGRACLVDPDFIYFVAVACVGGYGEGNGFARQGEAFIGGDRAASIWQDCRDKIQWTFC